MLDRLLKPIRVFGIARLSRIAFLFLIPSAVNLLAENLLRVAPLINEHVADISFAIFLVGIGIVGIADKDNELMPGRTHIKGIPIRIISWGTLAFGLFIAWFIFFR